MDLRTKTEISIKNDFGHVAPLSLFVLEESDNSLLNASVSVSRHLEAVTKAESKENQSEFVVILTENLQLWPLSVDRLVDVWQEDFETERLVNHIKGQIDRDQNHHVVIATASTWIVEGVSISKLYQFFQAIQSITSVTNLSVIVRESCCSNQELLQLTDLADNLVYLKELEAESLILRKGGRKEKISLSDGKRVRIDEDNTDKQKDKSSSDQLLPSTIRSSKEPESFKSLTTFKLGLSDKERSDRAKLTLPFEEQVAIHQKKKEATVEYVPDDNDDWDDEDPDDDLDI